MKYVLKNKNYHILIVLIFSAIIYFIGNAYLSITDPVESNYALTAKEMLLTKNYLSPQIFGHYWYDKPIFYYWELIVGFKLFGITNFGARFFSSLLALCNIFLIYRFVKAQTNHVIALVSAIIVSVSAEYWIIAKSLITDMTLGLYFNATLMSFYIGYIRHKSELKGYKQYYLLAYLASALAVLTKGPIGFLLPGLIILVYLAIRRDIRELFSLQIIPGLLLFLSLGGSWYYYMYITHGNDFINVFLGVHNWLRATVSEHPRFNVWYYYIPITIIALLPWSIILPKSIYSNRKNWFTNIPFHSFLAVWAGIVILFFTCMATKYSTYSFPALTPLTILIAVMCYKRINLIYKTAFVMGIAYIVLTFAVAVPQMKKASTPSISQFISQSISDDSILVQGSGRYRVSPTYYSGHEVYQLLGPNEVAPDPTTISWNAKDVMPFISINDLPTNKKIYLLVYGDDYLPDTINSDNLSLEYSNAEGTIYQLHR
ncbi:MAG: glycosyltransferase family 39 protein [Veillonella sp.]|nr:glycosyltransferase family 39 protein [Veillonella sp.]